MPDDITGNRVCPAANRTILIVDDIPENLRLLDSLLTAQGYIVRLAPSGAMALRAIKQQAPDLILLDILMPQMDGYEVCRRLKASEQTRSIPVIFLSALQEGSDKAKGFELGGADYITKPLQVEEIVARVEHQLQLLDLQQHLQQQQEMLQAQNQRLQQEICDRQQAEADLTRERTLLRTLIDAIPDLIFFKNPEGEYLLWNQAFEDFIGRGAETIHQQTDADLFSPEGAAWIQHHDCKVMETMQPLRFEERADFPDQRQRLFDTYKVPLLNATGEALGLIGVCRDITEQKHQEQSLRIIFEQTSAKTGQAFCCTLVRCLAEVLQVRLVVIGRQIDADRTQSLAFWQNGSFGENRESVLAGTPCGDIMQGHMVFHQQDVQTHYPDDSDLKDWGVSSYFGVPLMGSNNQIIGHLVLMDDRPMTPSLPRELILKISATRAGAELERQTFENDLQRAREEADAANLAKSEFLANISHELRTPLNAILGFTQLILQEGALDRATHEHLEIVNRSGEHLLTLINDVLEMSKIEAGKVVLNPQPFDLHKLLQTLDDMFSFKARAKEVALRTYCDPNVPRYIAADESKLRQILINLLSNAVKFTQQGHILLRVERTGPEGLDAPSPGDVTGASQSLPIVLKFQVEDTGFGIALQEMQTLFEPFVQATAGQKSQEGTGLGLPISQRFVQLMGGTIEVQTALEQGSTFSFEVEVLPITPLGIDPSTLVYPDVKRLAPHQPDYRLLVAEDHSPNRLLLVKMLTSAGFLVEVAEDGLAAVAQARAWKPHLILMDIRMPRLDGYAATQRIKAAHLQPDPVIIALTASTFDNERARVIAVGCDDFLRKPFRANQIFQKIAQHLPVQYLYRTNPFPPPAPASGDSSQGVVAHQLALALRVMSPVWIQSLQKAALRGSDEQILQLVQEIPAEQGILTQRLTTLARTFRFDAILELVGRQCPR
jgi:PAS domain S-box-containing protein